MTAQTQLGNEKAYPCLGYVNNGDAISLDIVQDGMTKREVFAMHAMQGVLASEQLSRDMKSYAATIGSYFETEVARVSVELADALLAALAKAGAV